MDVRPSDEQQMLQAMASALAADLAPRSVTDLAPEARAERDPAAWSTLVAAGLPALHISAERGGGGGRVVDIALVAEALAGSLAPVSFIGPAVWAPTMLGAAHADSALEAIVGGSLRLAPVLSADLLGMAERGVPGVAFDAQGVDAGLVIDENGSVVAIRPGETLPSVDVSRTMRRVGADAPRFDLGISMGSSLHTDEIDRVEAVMLAVLAADLVGVMQGALDEAVAYVGERIQFGVPVGSFQAVKHLAAHAAMLIEGARSSMWHAAWAADELPVSQALLAARQAKAYCSASAREVGEIAIQMLGGIGLTWEHFAHIRQRRILMSRRVLGDETVQYDAIAEARLGPGVPA